MPAHGYPTGTKGQLTTTGTLPSGLSLATDYWIIAVDADNVKFAANLADAEAGTAIDILGQGTDGAVHTFTPVALSSGQMRHMKSNDGVSWANIASPTALTADGVLTLDQSPYNYKYWKVGLSCSDGSVSGVCKVFVKGDGQYFKLIP